MRAIPTVDGTHGLPQPTHDLLHAEAVVFVFSKQIREDQSALLMEVHTDVHSILPQMYSFPQTDVHNTFPKMYSFPQRTNGFENQEGLLRQVAYNRIILVNSYYLFNGK